MCAGWLLTVNQKVNTSVFALPCTGEAVPLLTVDATINGVTHRPVGPVAAARSLSLSSSPLVCCVFGTSLIALLVAAFFLLLLARHTLSAELSLSISPLLSIFQSLSHPLCSDARYCLEEVGKTEAVDSLVN